MTKSQSDQIFANRLLNNCSHGDREIAHSRADDILLEALRDAGYSQTAEQFEMLRVNFWYA